MSKQEVKSDKVSNEDVYTWLGDDTNDLDNLIVIIGNIANGDYEPKDLLSDILQSRE